MLKEKTAFIFDESIFKQSELKIRKENDNLCIQNNMKFSASSVNDHIAAVSNNIQLLRVVETFVSFYSDYRKTRELKKQLNHKKRILDSMVNEASNKVEIEIEEYRKRKMYEIQHNRRMLEITLEKLREDVEYTNKQNTEEYRKMKDKKELIDTSRKDIESNLFFIGNIIREAEKNKMNNNKYYHQMNEKYRIEMRVYSKIIKKLN